MENPLGHITFPASILAWDIPEDSGIVEPIKVEVEDESGVIIKCLTIFTTQDKLNAFVNGETDRPSDPTIVMHYDTPQELFDALDGIKQTKYALIDPVEGEWTRPYAIKAVLISLQSLMGKYRDN